MWREDRAKIEALEAIREFPPRQRGRMPYVDAAGRAVEYEGPLRDLGQGIPRRMSTNPLAYRLQRACWHLALGYASGFPVRAILAFTVRHFWRIQDVRHGGDEILEVEVAEVVECRPELGDDCPGTAHTYAPGGITVNPTDSARGLDAALRSYREGGEAYIPLRPSERSREILAEVAERVSTSPECRRGMHDDCARRAFDAIAQKPIWCACPCHPEEAEPS